MNSQIEIQFYGHDGICEPGPGDFNEDLNVDLRDAAMFLRCFGGDAAMPAPECLAADLDLDEDVDLDDFAVFHAALVAP